MDPSELTRREAAELERGFKFDETHPPTAFRIQFVSGRSSPGSFSLTHGESQAIDLELKPIKERLEVQIMEDFRAGLYAGARPR
jgi:hypothetical protein